MSVDSDARLAHVLGTNHALTCGERQIARAYVEEKNRIRDSLTRQIAELERQVAEVQRDVAPYEALLAPSRDLPPEILSQIFIHCVPELDIAMIHPDLLPALLLRICRRRRDVALSTRALWSTIRISIPFITYDNNRGTSLGDGWG
ncbi:hypothetical protein HGRIS_006316 [Hohenbuehelia grisea]|uniref:F-box domain-containing protein n=1 Tax=Hohenbuehelia grisea TaxID=104357 RepID=A0ABR3K224_9AGAR